MGRFVLSVATPCKSLFQGGIVTYFKRRFSNTRCQQLMGNELSYWHTPGSEPLIPMTVGQLVDEAAQKWGEREALVSVHQGHRLNFIQVQQQVEKLAAGLLELGLQQGDRIGLWGPNSSQWYLTNLAAAKIGLILVHINPAYQVPELHFCLSKVGVKALVTADSFKTQNYPQMVTELAPELASCQPGELRSKKLPDLTTLVVIGQQEIPGAFRFSDVLESGSSQSQEQVRQLQTEIQPDEGCSVQFTSGTTGQPKGTLLSHHNVVNNSYYLGKRIGLHLKEHRICLQVPFFHCFGNVAGVLSGLHFGCTLALPAPSFTPQESVRTIKQENCSVVFGTPTMHVDLLSATQEMNASLPSLEIAVTGGAICSPSLIDNAKKILQLQHLCSIYGMTETSPATFAGSQNDPEEKKINTVGSVLDHVEVKVVNTQGQMVPLGHPGELWVRGYITMLGYWGDEAKTKEMIGPDRWQKTGDQFVLQEGGFGQVVGRLKDMIIRGGENIFPKEIEEFLESHPQVIEAQVYGVPDERYGEEVWASIRLKPDAKLTADVLKDYCKGKIAHFKIPKHIRFLIEFPKTVSGKIQKFKLQEMAQKEQVSNT